MLIDEVLERLRVKPSHNSFGYVIAGIGPGKDGDLLSLARHVMKTAGAVGLWLLMSPEWAEGAYEVLREANLANAIQIHARALNKVCAVPVDLLYVDPVASVIEMSLDPYVRLYQDARHLLHGAIIAIAGTDPDTLTGPGSAFVSVLMAGGWQVVVNRGRSEGVILEKI